MSTATGYDLAAPWPGVLAHHTDACPARLGRPCTCGPSGYRAAIDGLPLHAPVTGPVLPTVDEALAWQHEQQAAMQAFHAAVQPGDTVVEVIDEFLEAARAGEAVDAGGQPYDDEQLRDLRWSLRGYVASELTGMRIGDLNGPELRALIGRLDATGLSQGRTRAVVGALRALLRYGAQRGMVTPGAADLLVFGDTDQLPHAPPPPPTEAPMPMHTLMPSPMSMHTPSLAYMAAGEPPPGYPTVATVAPAAHAAPAGYVPDAVIWMVLKLVSVVFALIALVLVAESV